LPDSKKTLRNTPVVDLYLDRVQTWLRGRTRTPLRRKRSICHNSKKKRFEPCGICWASAGGAARGHTLLMPTTSNAINTTLYDKLNFNFIHDIVSIAGIVRTPLVMVIHPSFPAKTIPELLR
jgi:hypothetical protein